MLYFLVVKSKHEMELDQGIRYKHHIYSDRFPTALEWSIDICHICDESVMPSN